MKEIELINKRKPREKHFLQEDGTIVALIYDKNIHCKQHNKYEEIDNSLVKKDGYFHNKCNDYNVLFNEETDGTIMRIEKDDNYLEVNLNSSRKTRANIRNTYSKYFDNILYPNVLDDIDIEYQTLSNKVKETIVLYNNKYTNLLFEINTNLELNMKDNTIYAYNGKKLIFKIEKPFMIDSKGEKNNNVFYKLKKHAQKYKLELILDEQWITSSETVYPVYIDPTISNEDNAISLYDTYIYSGDTNVDRNGRDILKAGVEKVNNVNVENRTLIKFDLPEIGTGSEIIAANLNLIGYPSASVDETQVGKLVSIHRVTEDWTEQNATWEQMSAKFDNKVESLIDCYRSSLSNNVISPKLMSADITNLVKRWYRDLPNYGVMLKTIISDYVDENYQAFFSKNNDVSGDNPKPIISIAYRNQNGIENFLDYKQQSFTMGTSYINTFNGNMTAIFNIGNTISGNLPVSLYLIYNTNDNVLGKQTHFGRGYHLNYEQTVKYTDSETSNSLIYTDSDGTEHYLYQINSESNIYNDEDGLNLNLEINADFCTIKDKYNSIKTFTLIGDTYYLTEIKDVDGNTITIELGENNKISKVKDMFNSEVLISYTNDKITVTSPDQMTDIILNNGQINSIQNIMGTTAISYSDNNIISSITDVTGMKIDFEYFEQQPYRIKKVSQFGSNNTLGNALTFEYGFNTTRLMDNKGHVETIIFNAQGNVISRNNLKNNEEIAGAYSLSQEYGDTNNAKNRIVSNHIPTTHIKNYLKNSCFETNEESIFLEQIEGITQSYSSSNSSSGNQSLKIECEAAGKTMEHTASVPKGKYYTFSGYFKNSEPMTISLSYVDNSYNTISCETIVDSSEQFEKDDITIFYDENATSDLKIAISFSSANVVYIDSVQLEEGEVANNYNLIDNSDFSEGFSDWSPKILSSNGDEIDPNDVFSISTFNDNRNTALKLEMNPLYSSSFRKKFAVNGKQGDLYTVSFWYKNEGVPSCKENSGNYVMINFHTTGDDEEYCAIKSSTFNSNDTIWQYYSYSNYAVKDFNEIELVFIQDTQANNFYITNLSLFKDVTSGSYQYDDNGNIISITNQSKVKGEFNYNNNNLVSIMNPNGMITRYEYDAIKPNRLLSEMSSNGVFTKMGYDSYGNHTTTKISKNYISNIQNGEYRIRSKGTNKYLKAELNMVLLESNPCSNTIWLIEKEEDSIKFKYSILPNYFIAHADQNIYLSTIGESNTYNLELNDDGSFYIYIINITGEKKYLKSNGVKLTLEELDSNNNDYRFYIELVNELFIENSTKYTEDGKYIVSTTNNNMKTTNYTTDQITGKITSITNPNNQTTFYEYNEKRQLESVVQGDKEIVYDYNEKNMLSKITLGNMEYNIDYDEFANVKSVKIGDTNTLVSNEYESNNGNPVSVMYGNESINFEYDDFDRISRINKTDKEYKIRYDNNGNIAKIITDDYTAKFKFDCSNRLINYKNDKFKINYVYDSSNRLIGKEYKVDSIIHNVENIYGSNNVITNLTFDDDEVLFQYDDLNRVVEKSINNIYNIRYDYISYGNRATDQISSITTGNDKYSYQYDDLNNITHVYYNGELISQYYYNQYNELIIDEDFLQGIKTEYTYDLYGNILRKLCTNIVDNSIIENNSYTYENASWRDQLTNYNGQNIVYNEIGNPISISDNINISWKNGNELKTYNDITQNLSVEYKYDHNGIRVRKCINGVDTEYCVQGNKIIFEKTNNDIIYYLRDNSDLIGFKYNNQVYYYIKNLQEDIIGILDSNYNKIVDYVYDAWGNILNINDNSSNNIGIINSYRYRSYYYDKETDLYYLNNRYYNPKWGRFLNADSYLGMNGDHAGYNLYAYASNNPINYCDPNGQFIKKAWNWVKRKAKQLVNAIETTIKNEVKKIQKSIKNEVKKITQSKPTFVLEYNTGFGIGDKLEVGSFGNEKIAKKSFGSTYSNGEWKNFTNSEISVSRDIGPVEIGGAVGYTNYNQYGNPMAFIWDVWEDPNTQFYGMVGMEDPNTLYLGEVDEYGKTFIGFGYDWYCLIGFGIKIGFEIE